MIEFEDILREQIKNAIIDILEEEYLNSIRYGNMINKLVDMVIKNY